MAMIKYTDFSYEVKENYDFTGWWFEIFKNGKTAYVSSQAELRKTREDARFSATIVIDELIKIENKMNKLVENVINWAQDKQILKKENSFKQMAKVTEEVGEIASAIARDDMDLLEDGIGDGFVTLIILAKQNGLEPVQCLERAYNEIKNRKGKTIDGVFVKQEDL